MNRNPEYNLYCEIAAYLRMRYPKAMYHFDYGGLRHTKTQAGQMKAIQHSRGFPDLMILHPDGNGILFLEIKPAGTRLYKRNGEPASEHIAEQLLWLQKLGNYSSPCNKSIVTALFAVGFADAKLAIDQFMDEML